MCAAASRPIVDTWDGSASRRRSARARRSGAGNPRLCGHRGTDGARRDDAQRELEQGPVARRDGADGVAVHVPHERAEDRREHLLVLDRGPERRARAPRLGGRLRARGGRVPRGGTAERRKRPRRSDRAAGGGRWHPGRRVACASCGVERRGEASARRLSRRTPGPPLRRPGARDRRTRRARDLREQVVAELDAPLEERVQVLGEALVAQDAGAEVRRELAERVRKGLRISLRETRSAFFCDAPCDSPCCGSARSSDPWRRSWSCCCSSVAVGGA